MRHLKGIFLLSAAMLLAATTAFAQTIDTITPWSGATLIGPFGLPSFATFGEPFAVAATEPISSLAFEVGNCTAPITFRSHIWRWDTGTTRATSAIFDSGSLTITAGPSITLVTFGTSGLLLTPGNYVAFISASEDSSGPVSCSLGQVADATFTGGTMFFLDNNNNSSLWTTTAWNGGVGIDLAFQLNVGAAVPALPAWLTFATLLAAMAIGLWILRTRTDRFEPAH